MKIKKFVPNSTCENIEEIDWDKWYNIIYIILTLNTFSIDILKAAFATAKI